MTANKRVSGFTLVELIVASGILAIMVFAVGTLSASGSEAQNLAARLNRATEIDQDILGQMRLELVSSTKVFGSSARDLSYLAKFDLASSPPRLSGSRSPTITTAANNQKDTAGNEITGNMLFFARLAWIDHYRCASGRDYLIDVWRWGHYYLTPIGGGPRSGSPFGLDLLRAVSEPLADAGQITGIVDPTDLTEVLTHLTTATPDFDGVAHDRVDVVWDRNLDSDTVGCFRQIDPLIFTLSDTPISPRPTNWLIRTQRGAVSLLDYRMYSVATVYAMAAMGVGRFALVNTAGAGFPHGFEVQVVGSSSSKQVLLHLVIASTDPRGQVAWCDLGSVVDARDQ